MKDPWFYAGVTLALLAFSMIVNALTGRGHGIESILGVVISFVASTIVTIAYSRLALSASVGPHASWQELWAPEHILNMLGLTILQAAAFIVGIILLVIPGIIVALMFSMSQLSLVDKKLAPVAALKESYHLTMGHKWQLFGLMLILIVMNIAGAILLGLGLLVSIPVTLLTVAHVYRKLVAAQEPMVVMPVTPAA